jgi:2-hydroxychromene-2-carboxylate isomerase
MATLEFYFDCSSPWTYLCFARVHEVIERTGAEVIWKPILVGGVFNVVNKEVYELRAKPNPIKGKYYVKDLQDWANFTGIKIGQPPVFPVKAVDPMRGAIVAQDEGKLVLYAWAMFEAYWGDLKDISQPEEIAKICEKVGIDPEMLLKRIKDQDIKDRLKQNTEEVIERGGFGSPTMFVNGESMFFGNDRLPLVEAALKGELPLKKAAARG